MVNQLRVLAPAAGVIAAARGPGWTGVVLHTVATVGMVPMADVDVGATATQVVQDQQVGTVSLGTAARGSDRAQIKTWTTVGTVHAMVVLDGMTDLAHGDVGKQNSTSSVVCLV